MFLTTPCMDDARHGDGTSTSESQLCVPPLLFGIAAAAEPTDGCDHGLCERPSASKSSLTSRSITCVVTPSGDSNVNLHECFSTSCTPDKGVLTVPALQDITSPPASVTTAMLDPSTEGLTAVVGVEAYPLQPKPLHPTTAIGGIGAPTHLDTPALKNGYLITDHGKEHEETHGIMESSRDRPVGLLSSNSFEVRHQRTREENDHHDDGNGCQRYGDGLEYRNQHEVGGDELAVREQGIHAPCTVWNSNIIPWGAAGTSSKVTENAGQAVQADSLHTPAAYTFQQVHRRYLPTLPPLPPLPSLPPLDDNPAMLPAIVRLALHGPPGDVLALDHDTLHQVIIHGFLQVLIVDVQSMHERAPTVVGALLRPALRELVDLAFGEAVGDDHCVESHGGAASDYMYTSNPLEPAYPRSNSGFRGISVEVAVEPHIAPEHHDTLTCPEHLSSSGSARYPSATMNTTTTGERDMSSASDTCRPSFASVVDAPHGGSPTGSESMSFQERHLLSATKSTWTLAGRADLCGHLQADERVRDARLVIFYDDCGSGLQQPQANNAGGYAAALAHWLACDGQIRTAYLAGRGGIRGFARLYPYLVEGLEPDMGGDLEFFSHVGVHPRSENGNSYGGVAGDRANAFNLQSPEASPTNEHTPSAPTGTSALSPPGSVPPVLPPLFSLLTSSLPDLLSGDSHSHPWNGAQVAANESTEGLKTHCHDNAFGRRQQELVQTSPPTVFSTPPSYFPPTPVPSRIRALRHRQATLVDAVWYPHRCVRSEATGEILGDHPHPVLPGFLYLGGQDAAQPAWLRQYGITHVLRLGFFDPVSLPMDPTVSYRTYPLADIEEEAIERVFEDACAWMAAARRGCRRRRRQEGANNDGGRTPRRRTLLTLVDHTPRSPRPEPTDQPQYFRTEATADRIDDDGDTDTDGSEGGSEAHQSDKDDHSDEDEGGQQSARHPDSAFCGGALGLAHESGSCAAQQGRRERRRPGRVLVHCHAGVSRSTTIVLAYLMREVGLTLREAFDLTFRARPIVRPNEGFGRKLQAFERTLFNAKEATLPLVWMCYDYAHYRVYLEFLVRLEEKRKQDESRTWETSGASATSTVVAVDPSSLAGSRELVKRVASDAEPVQNLSHAPVKEATMGDYTSMPDAETSTPPCMSLVPEETHLSSGSTVPRVGVPTTVVGVAKPQLVPVSIRSGSGEESPLGNDAADIHGAGVVDVATG